MVDDHIWIRILLIDTSATPSEALGTDLWIIGLKDASNLATAT